jgi:hypothetical protein
MAKEFDFEDVDNLELLENNTEVNIPDYGQEGWEDYVISLLSDKEFHKVSNPNGQESKYPTLNGMRRVALSIFGKPNFSGPTKVETTFPVSYCIYELDFSHIGVRIAATADAAPENVAGNYSIYPSAIAESRAEARAYRKLLLISTASAEEIRGNEQAFTSVIESVNTNDLIQEDNDSPASDQQKKIIKNLCKKIEVSLDKFLEQEGLDIETLKKSVVAKLVQKLNVYKQDVSIIPAEIK